MEENSAGSSAIDLLLVDTTENESSNYLLYYMGYLVERFALKTESAEWTKRCSGHKEKKFRRLILFLSGGIYVVFFKKSNDED